MFARLKDDRGLAGILDLMGYVALNMNDCVEACTLFSESLRLIRQENDPQYIASVMIGLASAIHEQKDPRGARAILLEAIEIFEGIGQRNGIAEALAALSRYASGPNALQEARQYCQQSLQIHLDAGDEYHVVMLLRGLAEVHCRAGEYEHARSLLAEAARRCRGRMEGQWHNIQFMQGTIALDSGMFQQARRLTEEYQQYLCSRPPDPGQAMIENQFGWIALYQHDTLQARAHFTIARADSASLPSHKTKPDAEVGLSMLCCEENRLDEGRMHLLAALEELAGWDDWPRTARCLEAAARLSHLLERDGEAASLLGAATWMRETAGAPLPTCDRNRQQQLADALKTALGAEQFHATYAEDIKLTPETAIARARIMLAT